MSSKSLLLALILAMATVMIGWQVVRQWTPALDRVAIAGELDQRQRNRVLEVLLAHRDETNDIDDIGSVLGALEWVHHVRVRRSWPDKLVIEIIKQTPIAYWNDDAFINAEGHVFESPYADLSKLPQLHGPAGSEREVMSQYPVTCQVTIPRRARHRYAASWTSVALGSS
ncbi:MAG: FtsQ-type POTRA domain-containing protein [Gammaproteobacteria bacterium]|nr:FtsQ-type POTRA domain-containing protein [Gammaproteobacteria bacterium]